MGGGGEERLADPDWVLAHFTLAADLTALRGACRFARAGDAVVARYEGLPFPALAFLTDDAGQLASLAGELVSSSELFYLLVNGEQARLAERAFAVQRVDHEYQMRFAGDPARLDPGRAVELGPGDLAQMHTLAAEAELMALEANPFRYGPAFGVWEAGRLAAMGATHLLVPGAAEIGNIGTRLAYRRQGLARQVVAALVRSHAAQSRAVFLMVFQTNRAAVALYEGLGFVHLRPMFLMRCRLKIGTPTRTAR